MRWIIWLLVIFVAAIITAVTASNIQGNQVVSFIMSENRYDINFNAFVIFVFLAFMVLYIGFRIISRIISMPSNARRKRQSRYERISQNLLNEAILQYLAGRYALSSKNVKKALKFYVKRGLPLRSYDGSSEFCTVAHLLIAANENRLGLIEDRDVSLKNAILIADKSRLSEAPEAQQLLEIQWLIENNQPQTAREKLRNLDSSVARRIVALQMQLQVDRMENAPIPALNTVKLLTKHKAYEPDVAQDIMIESACKVLDSASSSQQVREMWQQLDKNDKKPPEVIAQAARKFASFQDMQSARDLVLSCWDEIYTIEEPIRESLLMTLDMCLAGAEKAWLDRLEKAQTQNPGDIMLAYLTGRLCEQHDITGRAQTLLEQAAQHQTLPVLLRQRAWLALAKIAEKNNDTNQANICYKQAGLLLNA